MIKCNLGRIALNGTEEELCAELTLAMHAVYQSLDKAVGRGRAILALEMVHKKAIALRNDARGMQVRVDMNELTKQLQEEEDD